MVSAEKAELWSLPHIDLRGVFRGSQEDVWRAVPEGHHLVGVGFGGNRLGPRQTCQADKDFSKRGAFCILKDGKRRLLTEIRQFQLPLLVDEEVLRLQVSVEDLPPVAIRQASQNLEEENLQSRGSDVGELQTHPG